MCVISYYRTAPKITWNDPSFWVSSCNPFSLSSFTNIIFVRVSFLVFIGKPSLLNRTLLQAIACNYESNTCLISILCVCTGFKRSNFIFFRTTTRKHNFFFSSLLHWWSTIIILRVFCPPLTLAGKLWFQYSILTDNKKWIETSIIAEMMIMWAKNEFWICQSMMFKLRVRKY